MFSITSQMQAGSDATMSLIELWKEGDLEGVKSALQRGADVNSKNEYGYTGLMWAVNKNHNSVVSLLLKTPNTDVNQTNDRGWWCALHEAVRCQNNDALKLLLSVPGIDVNTVSNNGRTAVHVAVSYNNI